MLESDKTPTMIPAPLWRRLAAILYDCFLIISLCFLVGFINLGIQMWRYGPDQLKQMTESGQPLGGPFFYLTLLVTIFSFFAFFWTRKGQTPGMQAWKLKILNEAGEPISMKQSLLRFMVALPSIFLGLVGLWWILRDRRKKSWQDYASGSGTYYCPGSR